jgi:hypothetical protein
LRASVRRHRSAQRGLADASVDPADARSVAGFRADDDVGDAAGIAEGNAKRGFMAKPRALSAGFIC